MAFFLLVFFSILILILSLLYFTNIFTDKSGPNEVVEISDTEPNKKICKIYIGDSVADQLIGHNKLDSNGSISMTLNAAMTVYGDYLLLDNLCAKNNQFLDSNTEVILTISLKGLATDLTRPTTYNYFIKPFYNSKFILKHNDPYVLNQLSSYNFLNISQSTILKFRPYLTENIENSSTNKLISDINAFGLKKILTECNVKHFKFSIYILPLSDYWNDEILDYKKEFKKLGLSELSDILDEFRTTSDKYFVFDHVHFKDKLVGRSFLNGRNAIVKRIY